MPKHKSNTVDLLLDSGAFSAWLRKKVIPIKDYIAWVREREELFGAYVGMDDIPKLPRTDDTVRVAAKNSYRNQQIMLDAGLTPVPVFHQGEEWKWLEYYLKDGEPYIGLSVFKDATFEVQARWLDLAFSMLTNSKREVVVKVHGFGITNQPMMLRYPFYSVDSTTWSLAPGYGHICIPQWDLHNFDYKETPMRIVASGVQQANKGSQNKQLEWMVAHKGSDKYHKVKDVEWRAVIAYLDTLGLDPSQVRDNTTARRRAFLTYYLRLAESMKPEPFEHRHRRRIIIPNDNQPTFYPDKWKSITFPHTKLMYATTFKNKTWAALMTEIGANTRLASYWELRERSDKELEHFVHTGLCLEGRQITRTRDIRKLWKSEGYRNERKLRTAARATQADEEEFYENR